MILIISVIPALLLAFGFNSLLRRHEYLLYGFGICLAVPSAVLAAEGIPAGLSYPVQMLLAVFSKGGLAGALFLVVMFTGALPDQSKARKKLIPVRRQLSILASVLAIGHGAGYGTVYFVRLFTAASELKTVMLSAILCSLLLLILLLPLCVTSFIAVRRRMKPAAWKRLQRWAYLFYALIYGHIILFKWHAAQKGEREAVLTVILYTAVFAAYLGMRLCREAVRRKKEDLILPVLLMTFLLTAGVTAACLLPEAAASREAQAFSAADLEQLPDTNQNADEAGLQAAKTPASDVLPEENARGLSCSEVALQAVETPASDVLSEENARGLSGSEAALPVAEAPDSDDYFPEDGIYNGSAIGYNGRLKVSVTVQDGRISDLALKSCVDDEPYVSRAVDGIFQKVLSDGSLQVDTVSSATSTSEALLKAIEDALGSAGGD